MATALEVTKEFLDSVLALVPADKQDEVRSKYSTAQDAIRNDLGSVASRQAELQAEAERLTAWRAQLKGWATTKETEFQTREAQLTTNPQPKTDPPVVKPGVGDPTDLLATVRQEMNLRDNNAVAFVADTIRVQQKHFQLYGATKPFALEEVLQHPKVAEIGIEAAYNDIHRAQIDKVANDAAAAREAEIRKDERAKAVAEFGNNKTVPFPVPGEDDSPMGVLERRTTGDGGQYGVQAAVDAYRQLRAGVAVP